MNVEKLSAKLEMVESDGSSSLYHMDLEGSSTPRIYVASAPETRTICNDPLCVGVEYTQKLSRACATTLSQLDSHLPFRLTERESVVLHLLRGGLNFGLRESLAAAFGWNIHGSAFLSAQRVQDSQNSAEWYITENSYKKVDLPKQVSVIFGDVVATGTSLRYALNEFISAARAQESRINSILFFTIGGPKAIELMRDMDSRCQALFPEYEGSAVVFFEGCFAVPDSETPLHIKLEGTDLLRRDSLMAPEFIASQREVPSYPLERCAIYDAGSRAFSVDEYLEDVEHYWKAVLRLAEDGLTFEGYVAERLPEAAGMFSDVARVSLSDVASRQLQRISTLRR